MSYSRFGEEGSDVYVYMDVGGYLCCCYCLLEPHSFHANSTQEMADHLARHAAAGHVVPGDVVPEMWADDAENFERKTG